MAAARDKAHFKTTGEALASLNIEAAQRDGSRSAEEKLLECFELSRLLSASSPQVPRLDEVAPVQRLAELRRRRSARG